ncbi:hypothetical protein OKW46_006610 [Paraburkholderia sp. WSM4179]|nr:hypothetical protein [Paraburkholderia sp. WSM4179]
MNMQVRAICVEGHARRQEKIQLSPPIEGGVVSGPAPTGF